MVDELAHKLECWFDQGRSLLDMALHLRRLSDASTVINALERLVSRAPGDVRRRCLLLQAHAWGGRTDLAEANFRKLPDDPCGELDTVVVAIASRLGKRYRYLYTSYRCHPASTMQNIGFWVHLFDGPHGPYEAITKIMLGEFAGREPSFYEEVLPFHPALASIAPPFFGVHRAAGGTYIMLTLGLVQGEVPDLAAAAPALVDRLIATYEAVAAVPIATVPDAWVELPQEFGLSHGYLAGAFHQLQRPERLQALVEWSLGTVRSHGYQVEVVKAVEEAFERTIDAGLERRIDPHVHLSLLHGDLHRHNVLAGRHGVHFIDWARWTTGPRGIDLAVLLRRCDPVRTLERITAHGIIPRKDPTARHLFCMALVVVSLMIDIDAIKEEPPGQLFLPMCAEMQRCLC